MVDGVAHYTGGAITSFQSNTDVYNTTFADNSCTDAGGGAFRCASNNPQGVCTIDNATFTGNTGAFGGALSVRESSAVLTNIYVADNFASNANYGGGGIEVGQTSADDTSFVTIRSSVFEVRFAFVSVVVFRLEWFCGGC